MKLVKFTKDVPSHSAFCGEVMGFADEDADRLVKAGKAIYAAAPAATAEPVSPSVDETADAEDAEEHDDAADDDKPRKRGPGRPRKAD